MGSRRKAIMSRTSEIRKRAESAWQHQRIPSCCFPQSVVEHLPRSSMLDEQIGTDISACCRVVARRGQEEKFAAGLAVTRHVHIAIQHILPMILKRYP